MYFLLILSDLLNLLHLNFLFLLHLFIFILLFAVSLNQFKNYLSLIFVPYYYLQLDLFRESYHLDLGLLLRHSPWFNYYPNYSIFILAILIIHCQIFLVLSGFLFILLVKSLLIIKLPRVLHYQLIMKYFLVMYYCCLYLLVKNHELIHEMIQQGFA